jgi:predicted nucleic acid-binding protein
MAWPLDTNILSERRKPKPEPKVIAFYDAQPLSALYVSVVSIAEIRFRMELQQDVTRRAELNDWLARKTAARPGILIRTPTACRRQPPCTTGLPS